MEIESELGIINSFRHIIPKSNIYNNALVGKKLNCKSLNEPSGLFIMNFTIVFSSHSIHTGPRHIFESRNLIGI